MKIMRIWGLYLVCYFLIYLWRKINNLLWDVIQPVTVIKLRQDNKVANKTVLVKLELYVRAIMGLIGKLNNFVASQSAANFGYVLTR